MLATKNKKEYQKQQNNILPKIEDVFPDRDAVQAKFSNPKAVKVIGIDLGEVFTVAACLKARYERERRKTHLVYRTESLVPPRRN
jgi:ribosomal protein L6P/L9E